MSHNVRKHTFEYVRLAKIQFSLCIAQADQNRHWAHFGQSRVYSFFMLTTKTLMILRGDTGCFEYSLGAHI